MITNIRDYNDTINVFFASEDCNGGRSVNKLRKFANFNDLLDLRTFRKCGTLQICGIAICRTHHFVLCNFRKYANTYFLSSKM
jgi:hypothetical protein